MSILLFIVGLSVCTIVAYEAVRYWQDLPYVRGRDYLMMAYYAVWFMYGMYFVAC